MNLISITLIYSFSRLYLVNLCCLSVVMLSGLSNAANCGMIVEQWAELLAAAPK